MNWPINKRRSTTNEAVIFFECTCFFMLCHKLNAIRKIQKTALNSFMNVKINSVLIDKIKYAKVSNFTFP